MKFLISILLLFALNHSLSQNNKALSRSIKNEILLVNRAMEQEFNQGNYEKIGQFYADSAVMVGNKIEIIGKESLIEYWSKFEGLHEWELDIIEITVLSSNLVLQRGFSIMSYYNARELQISRSIFSLIFIRTDEGWKILLDHFSPR